VPLYEYQCNKCGHRFEKIQKFSDPEVKKCPECGGAVEKLLHAPAVQFKGAGWYVTDYAGKNASQKKSESSSDESSASPAKEKSETKSDSKPDKKPKK
jgi:putative FmdB family regulatory protein